MAEQMESRRQPGRQGLYDPANEHDACGVGFVAQINGRKTHTIVEQGIQVLINLDHRGACGCEANTGDGAGILIQMPHRFMVKVAREAGFGLPAPGDYAVGCVFLPQDEREREVCRGLLAAAVAEEGQRLLGWRRVPTDNSMLGRSALDMEPHMEHVFIGRSDPGGESMAFERTLYVIRRLAENRVLAARLAQGDFFYLPSLSSRTLVYKGMLLTTQLQPYFLDLSDPDLQTAIALVHSRFSTNTFPRWHLAHPYRYIIHNGEINTIRGNENWMHAREAQFGSQLFGEQVGKVLPVVVPGTSDSARFDNCLEFLVLAGWSLPQAVMMMIPEPWAKHDSMSDEKRAFYEFHSCMMEPWDGPASVGFTDGEVVGAVLDRNGLRPSRYYVTKDGLVVMASEVGVLDIPPDRVASKGRLQPGRMFLVDTRAGRIVDDEELKRTIASQRPYREWLARHVVTLQDLPSATGPAFEPERLWERQTAFGYTFEELRMLLEPLATTAVEARGSMGNDAPPAVLSDRPQLLYNYFKQLFAQVTNPPIDAIREELVTASDVMLGPEGNLLEPEHTACRKIHLERPILTNDELAQLRQAEAAGFKAVTLPLLFPAADGAAALAPAMARLCAEADTAIAAGAALLILSDRGVDANHAAIPALLATAGLHHHLIRNGNRMRVGLVVETGEAREVHHFALLIGYGAGAVNPYLAFETIDSMIRDGLLTGVDYAAAEKNYVKGATKSVIKVTSKMGISTVQSYCGAQIFEALGLRRDFVDQYFTWTATRIEGIGIEGVAAETLARHARAFSARRDAVGVLDAGGDYQWRKDGERHLFNPQTIHKLQYAVRKGDYAAFQEYARLVDDQSRDLYTLRGLLQLQPSDTPVPLDEVESVESICRRFKTGAMSYGSISQEAHESLAIAMNRVGGRSNTGEGGEDPDRFTPDANGDLRRSAIKQVASGRFGVTLEYLVNADELQIKMAQGAKPGEGGELPGKKVYPWIAKVRYSTPGVGLISPPPHHDIYSIEDLAELIHDLKNANRQARINVKLVSEVGVGTIAAGVAKGHADVILISGYDGGTGASPQTSIKHAGLPWELGLAETHQTLLLNDLRSRVALEADGQLKTGRDVAIACLLGAEEFGFATAPLVALGCIMMRVCQKDTCPVGVATQNPELRRKFTGDPAHVVHFMRFIAQQLREWMAKLGFRTINEMVGRVDRIDARAAVEHWKASGIDLAPLLYAPEVPASVGRYCQIAQDHGLEKSLDMTVLQELCAPALERGESVEATVPIRNIHRVVGTIVGSDIVRRHGAGGLPPDTIRLRFTGSAGQSFGAFLPAGMTFTLEGDANDYFGKGLSGGRLIVHPPATATFKPEDNVIVGNVALYGATAGEAYVRGVAGERFCVRNSGVHAVVEAVGDHGCEYMTGGRVAVLGPTGRNFAAGMSGGVAYVLDEDGALAANCNAELCTIETLDDEHATELEAMIRRHAELTGSRRGWEILSQWETCLPRFRMVMPIDYRRATAALRKAKEKGLSGDDALMAAFQENIMDAHRVGGN